MKEPDQLVTKHRSQVNTSDANKIAPSETETTTAFLRRRDQDRPFLGKMGTGDSHKITHEQYQYQKQ